MSQETYRFLTTHGTSYVEKPLNPKFEKVPGREYDDPYIYKEYLLLKEENLVPPDEDGVLYLDRFKQELPETAERYFCEPLDVDLIADHYRNLTKVTEYVTHYCDQELEESLYPKPIQMQLADDAVISSTTYRAAFKDPAEFTKYLTRPPPFTQESSIGLNEKIARIVNTKTGESTYKEHIGSLAERMLAADRANQK